jgi:hypothetical protein
VPLIPRNDIHKAQIAAGTLGRRRGHSFETELTELLGAIDLSEVSRYRLPQGHLITGIPSCSLLAYIFQRKNLCSISRVTAWSVGGLATAEAGPKLVELPGGTVAKSKSDLILAIEHAKGSTITGVSVKTCYKAKPTNAQLYFTTATAFCNLLRQNGLQVSENAQVGLRMFCGDSGFRPADDPKNLVGRKGNPDRWFYEELSRRYREGLDRLFTDHQADITKVLLQKAYVGDPYPPEFLLHVTREPKEPMKVETAIYAIDELVELSGLYQGFTTREYPVRKKARFKGGPTVHLAPRFGVIQMQRGGQKQHPTQLQFNLEAGYFYKLEEVRKRKSP